MTTDVERAVCWRLYEVQPLYAHGVRLDTVTEETVDKFIIRLRTAGWNILATEEVRSALRAALNPK